MFVCSFCGKTEHEVKLLITGPKVAICNECVLLCHEIVLEKNFENKINEIRQACFEEFWQGA